VKFHARLLADIGSMLVVPGEQLGERRTERRTAAIRPDVSDVVISVVVRAARGLHVVHRLRGVSPPRRGTAGRRLGADGSTTAASGTEM
jgi:hypothetical protein